MYLQIKRGSAQALLASKPSKEFTAKLYFLNRTIAYQTRTGGKGSMGRFGGGWEIKFGFQSSSLRNLLTLRCLIVDLFVCSIRFGVQDASRSTDEASARAADAKKPQQPTAEAVRAANLAKAKIVVLAAERDLQTRPRHVAASDDMPF